MIAMIALMLAGAALMRSVGAGLLVAGNIGFKRAATASAELGIQQGFRALQGLASTDDATTTNPWYHPSFALDALTLDWSSQASAPVTSGAMSIQYVVQRMCDRAGAASRAYCLLPSAGGTSADSTMRSCDVSCYGFAGGSGTYYKITARARGPKGTESFVQVVVQR